MYIQNSRKLFFKVTTVFSFSKYKSVLQLSEYGKVIYVDNIFPLW